MTIGALEVASVSDVYLGIDPRDVQLDGSHGVLNRLVKAALERGLQAELARHIGYEKGDPTAPTHGNSRNGAFAKSVTSSGRQIELAIPRDRNGTFSPALVPKRARSVDGLDDLIISVYAGSMTEDDIEAHLTAKLGSAVERETIVAITSAIVDEVAAWHDRPLEAFYPVIYLDALVVRTRRQGRSGNRAARVAVGVGFGGEKHVLGVWSADVEGASFWHEVCRQIAARGITDVLVVCCDGVAGLPEAVATTWPSSSIQTCIVHLIRAAVHAASAHSRPSVAAALVRIYRADDARCARTALDDFADSPLGRANPATVDLLADGWDRFLPFLDFPAALRRMIYARIAATR